MKGKIVSDYKMSVHQQGINKHFSKVNRCETDDGLLSSLEVFAADRNILADWEADKINRADHNVDWWTDDE